MKLNITNQKDVPVPSKNKVNLFIDSETSTLKGKKSSGDILEFTGTCEGGSSMAFYKCAAVHEAQAGGTCYIISGCPTAEVNGTYLPTEYTAEDYDGTKYPVYSNGTYYYYYNDGFFKIDTDYSGGYLYVLGSSPPWMDSYWNYIDGMTMTESTVASSPASWDGYKAILTNGAYSFEKTLTTGLSYGTAFTPTVGSVYNSEANIKIGSLFMPIPIPQSGLVFYAPLNTDYVDMISSNSASVTAGSFTEINAKAGLRLTNEYIKWPESSNLPVGENDISFGFLIIPMKGSTRQTFMGVGNENSCLPIQYENESILGFGGDLPSDDKWHTVLLTRAGRNSVKIYIDGILVGGDDAPFYPESSCVCVGALMSYSYIQTSNAFFSEVFVYNRELTAAEVLEIHNTLMKGVTQDNSSDVGGSGAVTPEITFTTPVTLTGTQNVAITNIQLVATVSDGGQPSFTSNDLPEGLTLSSTGLIAGTPTVSGTGSSSITVSYTGAESKTITLNWTIEAAGDEPTTSDKTYVYTVSGAGYEKTNGDYWESEEKITHLDGTQVPTYTNGSCSLYQGADNSVWYICYGTSSSQMLYRSTSGILGLYEVVVGTDPAPTVTAYNTNEPDTTVQTYVVSGAGRNCVNGEYTLDESLHSGTDGNGKVYRHNGDDGFTYYLYKYDFIWGINWENDSGYTVPPDGGAEGGRGAFYYSSDDSATSDWFIKRGTSPAPTVAEL